MLMTLPGKRTKMNRNVTTDHNTTRPSGYRDRQSGKLQAYRSFAATHLHVYERLEDSMLINRELVNAGVLPREMKVNQEELESYFLNLTSD